jgi:hypothetical protein
MAQDYRLSTDRGIATTNGRVDGVSGDDFIRQHITLAILDVLAEVEFQRVTDDALEDLRVALRTRLDGHAQVERLVDLTLEQGDTPTTIEGRIVTDAVSVPFEEAI